MIEIKSYRGAVLHRSDKETIKAAVEEAAASGADLSGASLHGANLRDADLGDANLHGANLRGADLGDTYLGGADLRDADLRDADLRGADLGGAYLGGADLGGADLGDAKILPNAEMLTGYARYRWFAVWTDGGLLLHYGCERLTVQDWRSKASALAIRHHPDQASEYEALTLALVAFVEAALPKPIPTETEELRRLKGGDANGHSDSGVPVDPSGCCCGRRGSVLSQEGRVPTDPMNSPLNPEVNPPPYAALR